VEILAVTFGTDYQNLMVTLVKTDPAWTHFAILKDASSILDKKKRSALSLVSTRIRHLKKKTSSSRWRLFYDWDKDLIEKHVLGPVDDLGLNLDYALEVLGRYKRKEGRGRPKSTMVGYWMLSSHVTDLSDTIASHALFLQSLLLQKGVHLV
jgi:hypothetical protein